MIHRSLAALLLMLTTCHVPVWAADSPSGAAIEMYDSGRKTLANIETGSPAVKLQPVSSEPAERREQADRKSWWGSFGEMVGLTASAPGLSAAPTDCQLAVPQPDYIIGPGDVIGISVWKDDSLTRTVVVLPDGKITFPLLGDLVAGGKSVAQLKLMLEAGLTRYVADSSVTVEVKQSNSMIIYIIGRVNGPGRQVLVANTNVLQALAMAGGPNPFANKRSIKVFRQESGKTNMYLFDYNEVSEGRHLEMNIELKRGDVIIVP